ncbi:unnamed protein product [Didymodactylos carnosus]|uniref:NAD-dependent epimerase/dehydratase domain-containing protein n=1 Tax=Didymodactylos carnosus TaxID=1234261 RepID=A0A815AMD7_9BILA|nr:unnamed protein product [Didymodactylos carnosus]CAF1259285.1 unnamed protein product [Didymodactylos carnosus]CAF3829743.1 unnamed protein product [Didymodactylos carnosus]CAF4035373.1 unnamed protein product [Didymodactylos carnosus]
MSSSVFVSGAGGYIGFDIAKAFRRAGYRVYGLIRNQKYSSTLIINEIIPVVAKLSDTSTYVDIMSKCSIIIDAVGWCSESQTFLDAAIQAGRNRGSDIYKPLFIFTSGIMTYGDASRLPLDETIKPKPKSIPGDMKEREEFEDKILLLKQTEGVYPVVVRPGFVYGGQGGFVADLFYKIGTDKELVLYGRSDKRWSWVHIDDLSDAYVLIARSPIASVKNQMFNIAAQGDNPTYEQLRVAMAQQLGWSNTKNKIIYHSVDKMDEKDAHQLNWEPDVIINPKKITDQLGWTPKHVGYLHEIEIYYQSWLQSKKEKMN